MTSTLRPHTLVLHIAGAARRVVKTRLCDEEIQGCVADLLQGYVEDVRVSVLDEERDIQSWWIPGADGPTRTS